MKAIASATVLALLTACGSSSGSHETTTSSKPRATQRAENNPPARSTSSSTAESRDARRETEAQAATSERPPQTAQDQSETETDLRITQNVRQAIVANGALSMTAKNVAIITRGRVVTLRGRVLTAAESTSIETNARETEGVTRVENALEIRP